MPNLRKRSSQSQLKAAAARNGHHENFSSGMGATDAHAPAHSNGHKPLSTSLENQRPPAMYKAIRFFFKICLHSFYGNVEVECTENIAPDNYPAILVANHSNSLTDAIAILSTVPSKSRSMIRMTAKDTFWHKPGVFNYVIKSAGTIPIKRRKDYDNKKVDNAETMSALIDSLGTGSCVCMFPEGISRYHPQLAPFKAGVAMIASDTLSKFQDRPDFSLTLMTASINYLHREKFRSDVLVTFHDPIVLTPQQDPKLFSTNKEERAEAISKLTELLENTVRSNLLDAQDWQTVRLGHVARKLYGGDLGTRISLGQYVRLTRKFVAAFSDSKHPPALGEQNGEVKPTLLERQLDKRSPEMAKFIEELGSDLAEYQDHLDFYCLKDYRIKQGKPPVRVILSRLGQRFLLACLLASICIPGLFLWAPVFIAVKYQERKIRQKGPLEDNLDEIAQYKLMIATFFLPLIWGFWVLMTLPIAIFTAPGIVILMWLTIRWLEDLIHNAKSMLSLLRLMFMTEDTMYSLQETRAVLAERVNKLAVEVLNLPEDPEELIKENKTKKADSGWMGKLSGSYFSIKRRRRKDWNEVMRLHDVSNYD
ncbi:glycerol-3-phosphate O-acyltransferase / dihydroxyacetone phosphate acyltransferase [Entomortierella parvispora]|uniref:Glycerol-3-phosphate O-acyltransferase / dihydroxyacetone phosphate acyltransferase n=1 Tax=Entomortierella parvispora TaxID=205924 RepID=A0A9P3HH16_9FUNG|nr:glycerol-3-phosphate O-acyltransferase / dihydroxyacetone phosphate acyltransferase [Entomortierella parvispora]